MENFSDKISSAVQELRTESALYDISLVVGQRHVISAHRLVLSACSNVLRDIIRSINNPNHPYIYLKGVQYEMMSCMMDFMYRGTVSVAQENFQAFLDLAEELQVHGFTDANDKQNGSNRQKTKSHIKSDPTTTVTAASSQ